MMGEFKKTNLTSYVDVSSVALGKGLVVMWDTDNENRVKLPTGTNAGNIAGVNNFAATVDAVNTPKQVSICSDGDVYCYAAAAIAIGDMVCTYSTAGLVMAIPVGVTPAAVYNVVGEALTAAMQSGDLILIRLKPSTQMLTSIADLTN